MPRSNKKKKIHQAVPTEDEAAAYLLSKETALMVDRAMVSS